MTKYLQDILFKFIIYLITIPYAFGQSSTTQVGIGVAQAQESSILHLESDNQALVITRVSSTSAITNPVNGMIVYDLSSNCIKGYSNNLWSGCGFKGSILGLNCSTSLNNGNLIVGLPASQVTSSIPYTGGNGNSFTQKIVPSTGVTGLTASLTAGNFANGNGSLDFKINGTPNQSGIANFNINIGGQSCTLMRIVSPGSISSLSCVTASTSGTIMSGVALSGVFSTLSYTGGNGGKYDGVSVNSTGVTGLIATLTAGNFAVGTGTITYAISGIANTSGTASFNLNLGGQNCTLNLTVSEGAITNLNCLSATLSSSLKLGVNTNGISISVPYTGGNGGNYTMKVVNSSGILGITATLSAGSFANGSGTLTYNLSGTANSVGLASFNLNIGGQNCSVTFSVIEGTISFLNCPSATISSTLEQGENTSGITISIPYTGGNGGNYTSKVVSSSGITGITATLAAGTFANGSGTLTYALTGTANSVGSASFNLNIGGQSCTLTFSVIQTCGAWAFITDVSNQPSGNTKVWKKFLCHNLGANTTMDAFTYHQDIIGDLYQWGRKSDGHELINSFSVSTMATNYLATTPSTVIGKFIQPISSGGDWLSGGGYDNRWGNGTTTMNPSKGMNDPCPSGYKVPSASQWGSIYKGGAASGTPAAATANTWTWTGNGYMVGSSLFLPAAGFRFFSTGVLISTGSEGFYWTATTDGNDFAKDLNFKFNLIDNTTSVTRSTGNSVRCIKE